MEDEVDIKHLKDEESKKLSEYFKDNEPQVDERLRLLKHWTIINSLVLLLIVGVAIVLVTKLIQLQAQVQQFNNETIESDPDVEKNSVDPRSIPQLLLSEEVHYCCGQRGEQSPTNLYYETELFVDAPIQVEVRIGQACSDLKFYVYVDGKLEAESAFIGGLANLTTTGPMNVNDLDPGIHTIQIRPEGRADVNGCNVGTLNSWGGTISFYVTPVPSP